MVIEIEDSRGKKRYIAFPSAISLQERIEALEEFLSGVKNGEWWVDVEGFMISPVHILRFRMLQESLDK